MDLVLSSLHLRLILFTLLQLIVIQNHLFCKADPTDGFTPITLSQSNFQIQKPYDVSINQRYSFINGVHKMWVFKTDKPHTPTSQTKPRTEIRITVKSQKKFNHLYIISCKLVIYSRGYVNHLYLLKN